MLTKKDITRLLAKSETDAVEFKLAKGGVPASFWESYSAFANTDGGVIILGVKEDGGKHSVVGVTNANKLVADVWNAANNPQRVSANVLFNHQVYKVDYQGKTLVVVEVPRAERTERPVYVGHDVFRGTFRRNGEGDYHCSKEARNSRIFNIFALINIGERSGTGLSDIYSIWKEYGYEEPTITETYQPDQTTVTVQVELEEDAATPQENAVATQETPATPQEIAAAPQETPAPPQETALGTTDLVLALINEKPEISLAEIAEKLGISRDGVKYHIDRLKQSVGLIHDGPTKKGRWIVTNP